MEAMSNMRREWASDTTPLPTPRTTSLWNGFSIRQHSHSGMVINLPFANLMVLASQEQTLRVFTLGAVFMLIIRILFLPCEILGAFC